MLRACVRYVGMGFGGVEEKSPIHFRCNFSRRIDFDFDGRLGCLSGLSVGWYGMVASCVVVMDVGWGEGRGERVMDYNYRMKWGGLVGGGFMVK